MPERHRHSHNSPDQTTFFSYDHYGRVVVNPDTPPQQITNNAHTGSINQHTKPTSKVVVDGKSRASGERD